MTTLNNWPTCFLFMPKIKQVPGSIEDIEQDFLKKDHLNFIPKESSILLCRTETRFRERLRETFKTGTVVFSTSMRVLLKIDENPPRPPDVLYELFYVVQGYSPAVICLLKDVVYDDSKKEQLQLYALSLAQDVLHRIRMFTSENISLVHGVVLQEDLLSKETFARKLQLITQETSRFCNPFSLSVDASKCRNVSLACLVSMAVRKDAEDLVIVTKDEFSKTLEDAYRRTQEQPGKESMLPTDSDLTHQGTMKTSQDKYVLDEIETAKYHFIKTEAYRVVKTKLKEFGYVTITGASGEGKTMTALVIAGSCIKHGYRLVFVNNLDDFKSGAFFPTNTKTLFIFDDLFDGIDIPKNAESIRTVLASIAEQVEDVSNRLPLSLGNQLDTSVKSLTKNVAENTKDLVFTTYTDLSEESIQVHKPISKWKNVTLVIVTSKTYNFSQARERFKYERYKLLNEKTVVDVTKYSRSRQTLMEKKEIFGKHKETSFKIDKPDPAFDEIGNMITPFLGFPIICKFYFMLGRSPDVFQRPFEFLVEHFKRLLQEKDLTSAILFLMVLCENQIDLQKLEKSSTEMMEKVAVVKEIFPSASARIMYDSIKATNAKTENLFHLQNGTLSFSHTVLYDACVLSAYEFDPVFLLKHGTLDFLFQRIKLPRQTELAKKDLQFINISRDEVEIVVTKILKELSIDASSPTFEQLSVGNEHEVIEKTLSHLNTHDINKGKSDLEQFLSWLTDFKNVFMIQQIPKDKEEKKIQKGNK